MPASRRRTTKPKDLSGKLVLSLRARERVWALCSRDDARVVVDDFLKADAAGSTWFSLMPHAPTVVRIAAVESLYYLGPPSPSPTEPAP